jgi:hypothetical protein
MATIIDPYIDRLNKRPLFGAKPSAPVISVPTQSLAEAGALSLVSTQMDHET